ncbi:hypothetical protein Plhal304r1_c014g0053231 [Plasmopara halstedii]
MSAGSTAVAQNLFKFNRRLYFHVINVYVCPSCKLGGGLSLGAILVASTVL